MFNRVTRPKKEDATGGEPSGSDGAPMMIVTEAAKAKAQAAKAYIENMYGQKQESVRERASR
jgi:hypothetical protein